MVMGKDKEAAVFLLFWGVVVFQFQLSSCFTASFNKSSLSRDESSLLALKAHINSDVMATNWSQNTSFCNWIGVICGRRHARVIGLHLPSMNLRGSVAREIGNLSFLRFLSISNNSLSGVIPHEIGNLRRLQLLKLGMNNFSGDIPATLSSCTQLITLDLINNSLTGNIPIEFANFSMLRNLYLFRNKFTGELPSTIFNASSLVTVSMGYNQFSGSIPNDICRRASKLKGLALHDNQFDGDILSSLLPCRSLTSISLAANNFTGKIPDATGNWSSMELFALSRNKFTGTIPPSIGNLSRLSNFDIGENSLHGGIPVEIERLSRLYKWRVSFNNLNGEVPHSIFNLSTLEILALPYNSLSGSLPFSIDEGLPNIREFYINSNNFHGRIPSSVSNLSGVSSLELATNFFSGYLPINLGKLGQLQFLNLARNQFMNNMSDPQQDFVSSLTRCKYLRVVQLSMNPIVGVLPQSLGSSNLTGSLELFLAESCRIIGLIPNALGNLSRLLWLDLGHNELKGGIPAALGHLTNLQKLELDGNHLHGSISSHALCNLRSLSSLNLAQNNFSGELGMCLGNLSLLREIDFNHNSFISSIPWNFWSNVRLERVYLSDNFLDGSLSPDIGNLKGLIELDLSGNKLSGEIPTTVFQLQNLINLSLSNNKLDGLIVESFANLKDLQSLDLSHNNLSGPIPKSLEALSYLQYFNVSFNKLSGEIPDEGPFRNFTAEFFKGNQDLCGAPRFHVKACTRSVPAHNSSKSKLRIILPSVACSIVVAALIVILVRRRRGGRLLLPSLTSDVPLGIMHQRISHYEILRATRNLSEDCMIGRGRFGSVYMGNFSNGLVAAVKVFNLDLQGAAQSFDTECEIIRSIRHRNLVKVITSCSNLDFKALVMEYMPNGNLEKWLHSADSSLNLSERLGIMIDVASALKYLHEGYSFPIAHCDLKPNNILLDEDMVAHVGDFGIAKLMTEDQRTHQTRTLGSIGYMAPEYGSEGLISTMADVYSYGIMLMETISRRKPTDEMFCEELTMRKWMLESFPDAVVQLVDKELLTNMDDQKSIQRCITCLTSIIGLAVDCTTEIPGERPQIKDVVARINKIKINQWPQ